MLQASATGYVLNQKLSLNSQAEAPSDDALTPSDDAIRQALLRMGAGGGLGGASGGGHNGHARRGGEQASAASASPDARRRRFSQNEHVPVEYVSRDRSPRNHETRNHETGRHDVSEPADDRTAALEREFEREKQARLTAERSLAETRTALQHAQTRLAHLEIDLTEARAQRQALLAVAPAAPAVVPPPVRHDVSSDDLFEAEMSPPIKRGRGRPRLSPPRDAVPEIEPEPVKWWIGD